jgi:nucleotide-binding universal stress UspA family protein
VTFGRILWACDFSDGSLRALRSVIPLARACGSEITALHVIPTHLPMGPLSLANPALLRPDARHQVAASLDRCIGPAIAASLDVHVLLREGKPADEIMREARRLAADLIVVGTRGSGERCLSAMGSVAEAVLGRAPCPVLAVPRGRELPAWGGRGQAVVWATDFSPPATRALSYARWISARTTADLVLVHVVQPGRRGGGREHVHAAERRLADIGPALRGRRLLRVVSLGDPAPRILRIARERNASLVVMGTQGSRTIHSILGGSTARRVVRGAPCPVLAVP